MTTGDKSKVIRATFTKSERRKRALERYNFLVEANAILSRIEKNIAEADRLEGIRIAAMRDRRRIGQYK